MKPNRLLFFFGPGSAGSPRNRQVFLSLLTVVVLLVASVMIAGIVWYSAQLEPVSPFDSQMVTVKVQSGMTTGDIADLLTERGLIRNRNAFLFAARRAGLDKSLQAGEYALSRSMSVSRMIEIMSTGRTIYSQFTVPEGFTVEQMATMLEEKGLASQKRFLALAKDYSPFEMKTDRPDVKYRAEGFLFPDTYQINRGASEEQILKMMADEFLRHFSPELQKKAILIGISPYEAVVLASLIEREARLAAERPLVARVFLNRIKLGMPLQSCATIQYILGYPKEDLTIADTQLPSAYNTYLHPGMPPGPVASPGLASILAALNPAEGDWLYFVVDGKTGGHRFSRTLEEHEEAIEQIGK